MNILGALVTQGFSFWTTLAFVMLFTRPGTDPQAWGLTLLLAAGGEVALFAMKECIFRRGCTNRGLGVAGFVGDGFINAGGLTAIAVGVLTFGPSALILGTLEINLAEPSVLLVATGITSFALGLTLSIAPHILWRNVRPAPVQRAV